MYIIYTFTTRSQGFHRNFNLHYGAIMTHYCTLNKLLFKIIQDLGWMGQNIPGIACIV